MALFGMLLLRAGMPYDFALGHPDLNLRYLMPVASMLAIFAVVGARSLAWRSSHLILTIIAAAVVGFSLLSESDDFSLSRRLVLLRGTLLVAALLLAVVLVAARRSSWKVTAAWMAALAFGVSAGVTLGSDLAATIRFRLSNEAFVEAVASATPERFALIGYPDQLDAPLTLRAFRDVEYADLGEVSDSVEVGDAVRAWLADGRPVFAVFPVHAVPPTPWPDLAFVPARPKAGLVAVVPGPLPMRPPADSGS